MADRRSAVPVCRYYLQGYCAYGSRCHYDHPPKAAKAKKPEASSRAHLAFPRPTASAAASASASAASAAASWADAPPFIPGGGADSAPGFSYAARLAKGQAHQRDGASASLSNVVSNRGSTLEEKALVDKFRRGEVQMCPIALATGCCLDASCKYLHGEPCPCCGRLALVPGDIRQNNQHVDECVAKLERQFQASLCARLWDVQFSLCPCGWT